ncbi:type II toxin-antitoxin system death-on-curing family toxin [Gulosibacter bifidus]|uniref:Type II toxin-antitoxin system death-on-curing family toxin n=1 Tax=Gulosibacter bifidus TaxID=272239 RepID=A0ABW5RH16_9MICO|nr:type II toxin-antitoxin system death-on-curing family toxin [Gulosibacter bifidus]
MSFYYLDYDTVEIINRAFCGLGAGVRDPGGVRAVLARPQSGYSGQEFFPTVFDKGAALLHGFVTTQYFFDGNKRTGFLSATVFLECNGFNWDGPDVDAAEGFLLSVAAGSVEVEEVADWLAAWCSPAE